MSNPPPPWPYNGPPYQNQNQNQNQNQQQYSQPMQYGQPQYGQPQYGYQPQYGQPSPQPVFINYEPVFNFYHYGPPAQGPMYPPMQQMGHPPLGSTYPQQQTGPTYQQMPHGGGPVPQTGPGFVETDSIAATSVPSTMASPKMAKVFTAESLFKPLPPRPQRKAHEEQEPDLSSEKTIRTPEKYSPPPFEQGSPGPVNGRRMGASQRSRRNRKHPRQTANLETEVSMTDVSDLEAEAFANWRAPPLLLAKYDNDRMKMFAEAGPTCIEGWKLQKKHESNPLAVPRDRDGRQRRS